MDPEILSVLRILSSDLYRVGTLSADGTPAQTQAVRQAARLGLAEWRIGKGYAITDAGRAALAAAK